MLFLVVLSQEFLDELLIIEGWWLGSSLHMLLKLQGAIRLLMRLSHQSIG